MSVLELELGAGLIFQARPDPSPKIPKENRPEPARYFFFVILEPARSGLARKIFKKS